MYEQNTIEAKPTARTSATSAALAPLEAALSPAALSPAALSPAALSPAALSPAALDGTTPAVKKPVRRGFAVLDAERRREIARLGGKTAHANGNAHRFNPEEASLTGKKGGAVISENRDYMANIGRRGGLAKRGYKLRRAQQNEADTQSN